MAEKAAGDFLKREAKTPLQVTYSAAGTDLGIETNSKSLLRILDRTFERVPAATGSRQIFLKLWVDAARRTQEPRRKPYFRGLGHLVFAGFDEASSVLMDLRRGYAVGRLTPQLASDATFWRATFFPSFLTIFGPAAGVTPLHCACVALDGTGILLAGSSGAGKSTLSLALAQRGFDFLSDDRTLVGIRDGAVRAWGLSAEMKQNAKSVGYFPELRSLQHSGIWKGERILRFDPAQLPGINRIESCEPRWIFFLERQFEKCFLLEEIPTERAVQRLEKDLHREMPAIALQQRERIERLVERGCRVLRYGGNPHEVAEELHRRLGSECRASRRSTSPGPGELPKSEPDASDPLRRFRSTNLSVDIVVMGRPVRIETDSLLILERTAQAFARFGTAPSGGQHRFLWRIVSEPAAEVDDRWPPLAGFSDHSLRYINIGRRSFIAVDLPGREAVGILPESLIKDDVGFSSVFLASMFYLTAPALRLISVSAACVAHGNQGLLLFGPPNSGKTTSSYAARSLGMGFHADQSVFMEVVSGEIRAWGDFWPAAFRPETSRFLPELAALCRPFSYRDRSFLCLDKEQSTATRAETVLPVACVFLERANAVPRLVPLSRYELSKRFGFITPFKEDAGSQAERTEMFDMLSRLPAYRLACGDPSAAAVFLKSILNTHLCVGSPS